MKKMLKEYMDMKKKICNMFFYDNLNVIVDDLTDNYWMIIDYSETVRFAETKKDLYDEDNCYESDWMFDRHVVCGHTSIECEIDNQLYLLIFDNDKQVIYDGEE